MHPDAREGFAARGLGLRDLVLVVREDQVAAAAVHVEVHAEQLLRHRRALDVPAGPAIAPRRGPRAVLALLARLPEREVLLALFQSALLALVHLLERAVRELAVAGEARDAEVHVAARAVGVAGVDQRLDQFDDRGDRLAGERLGVRPADR